MKVLITGANGMLGRTLCRAWRDLDILGLNLPEADVTDLDRISSLIVRSQPDAVVHCAAMTDLAWCEENAEIAFKVNGVGTANVALSCARAGARMMMISSNCVFSGDNERPWRESDPAEPCSVYGRSKLAGERAVRTILPDAHVIVRAAWLYGAGDSGFLHEILTTAQKPGAELEMASDQLGSFTSTAVFAGALRFLLENPRLYGTYHVACEGECSCLEFAEEVCRLWHLSPNIVPRPLARQKFAALRPGNACLDCQALRDAGCPPLPDWKSALEEYFRTEIVSKDLKKPE